jgi:hypothetical protein
MKKTLRKQISSQEKQRFNTINAKHPSTWTSEEKKEFNSYMGKYYFNLSLSKTKTQSQKKFYRNQAKAFFKK